MKSSITEPCHQHGKGARHDAPLSFIDAYCVKRNTYCVKRNAYKRVAHYVFTHYALRMTVLAVALPLLLLFLNHSPTAAQTAASERAQAELAIGLDLYQERCANCHGPEGMGDGEIAGSLPRPPRDYTNADFQHTAVPFDLFMALTNGIPAGAMPPFGPTSSNPLSETDRWRLVSAIYALGANELTLAVGADIYQTSCAECHGEDGRELPAADLTDPIFWVEQSNAQLLAALQISETAEHDGLELGDADGRALFHFMRLSFDEPAAIMAPLPLASVSGQVTNGSLNAPLTGGAEARLRAFTAELDVALDVTTPVDADGFYQFSLENEASPGWFYRVTVMHNGLEFNSNFDQLSRQNPALELPVTVFDTTTDSAAIRIDQLHIIVDFIPGYMRVGQLYSFSNMATAVYVGPTGSAANGTVTVNLPANAEDVFFERALGGMEQFVPVNEIISTGSEYAYTLPLRPGQGSLNLLVQYVVPYESSVTLRHPLAYDVQNVNMVLPADNSLRLGNEGNWREMEQAQFGDGAFRSFSGAPRSAGSEFVLSLSGRPTVGADGQPMAARDQTVELLLGGAALLLVVAAVAFFWQRQQQAKTAVAEEDYDSDYDSDEDSDEEEDGDFDPADLLQAIADLDASYEAGEISEKLYKRQRMALKEALKAAYR
jgi:mono/diheme cytochrome c family protein